MNDQGEFEDLLQNRVGQNFLLDSHFELDSSGMRFGPDEGSVDQADFHQRSSDLLQADGCELVMYARQNPPNGQVSSMCLFPGFRAKLTVRSRMMEERLTKQLPGFRLSVCPSLRRRQEPLATTAKVQCGLFGDTLGDINCVPQTSDTYYSSVMHPYPDTKSDLQRPAPFDDGMTVPQSAQRI